jgi:hypothetical protein
MNPRIETARVDYDGTGDARRAAESASVRRNIGSIGRKSTCNGLAQRGKLNGLLHFFSTSHNLDA